VLFASEHGPYWEVGLARRNRIQLVDRPHAEPGGLHAGARVTNGLLSVYRPDDRSVAILAITGYSSAASTQ